MTTDPANLNFDISLEKGDPAGTAMNPAAIDSKSTKGKLKTRKSKDQQPLGATGENEGLKLGQDQKIPEPSGCCSFCSLEYWQPYFLVEWPDVKQRLWFSINPRKTSEFIEIVDKQPDLYGPIWISSFLIFGMVICSSLSITLSRIFFSETIRLYEYDFRTVGFIFMIVYGFLFFFPAVATIALKFLGAELSFVKNLCIYGYSFTSFVVFLIILWYPSGTLRTILMIISGLYSTVRLILIYNR